MDSLEAVWSFYWPVLLAVTAALVLILSVRLLLRQRVGPEAAFLIWTLWPLAIAAALLPHSRTVDVPAVASRVLAWTPVNASAIAMARDPAFDAAAPAFPWFIVLAGVWAAGMLVTAATAIERQRAYGRRISDALPLPSASGCRIVQAGDQRTGPALVGVIRPRIVVPSDFAERYDDEERALILAHEAMHARRGDGMWCLFAQCLACLCWFHPLVWLAMTALRRDIELACDAAVMREQPGACRRYADAMLKTQLVRDVLPVGCAWSSRHPLVERVSWLRRGTSLRRPRAVGWVLGASVMLAGAVYAVEQPAPFTGNARAIAEASHFSLKLLTSKDGQRDIDATLCLARGQTYHFESLAGTKGNPWHGTIRLEPYDKDPSQIIALTTVDGGAFMKYHPELHSTPGEPTTFHTEFSSPAHGDQPSTHRSFGMGLTMRVGC